MDDEATTNDIHKAAEPRSDQLNADSLIAGPITVTVESVRRGNKEQPIIIELVGHPGKPYKPAKGMLRILIAAWTDDPHVWVGRKMRLFRNPDVKYAGVAVGGIEISHLSDIPPKLEFMKTVSRGVKAAFIVHLLKDEETPPLTEAEETFVEDVKNEIANCETQEALKAVGFILGKKSEAVRNIVRPLWAARQKEIEEML